MFDRRTDGRWWDIGLDLVTGCSPVSQGCVHCWSAEKTHRAGYQRNPKIQARYGGLTDFQGNWIGEVRPQWQDLDKIGRARKPQAYTFWNDLFHPGVEEEFVTSVMLRILHHPQHFFIICTKRPERALEYFSLCHPDYVRYHGDDPFKRRLMIMTTAENQAMADLRAPILLQIPDVLHGVSIEPALGPVDLWQPFARYLRELDWVICGGETGPHARPLHPDWVRSLRDQCQAATVPFFFKNWGEWAWRETTPPGKRWQNRWNGGEPPGHDQAGLYRVGKKAAGCILDGRTWDEVPK